VKTIRFKLKINPRLCAVKNSVFIGFIFDEYRHSRILVSVQTYFESLQMLLLASLIYLWLV
jgi:hypothetical protein